MRTRVLSGHIQVALCFLCAAFLPASHVAAGIDEAWANDPHRNMVLDVENLPDRFDETTQLWQVGTGARWAFPMPTIVGDRVLVGAAARAILDERYAEAIGRAGTYTCRRLSDGEVLWQFIVPCNTYHLSYGICTRPVIEGDRIYMLALGEVICLDLDGLSDGNQGLGEKEEIAFQTSVAGKPLEGTESITSLPEKSGDLLWRFSLWDLEVKFHDATSCTALVLGDQLWISTAHIVGSEAQGHQGKGTDSNAPHLIVLDKNDGTLLARDRMDIPYIFHGEWSSPSVIEVRGEKVVLFADGHGFLHGLAVPEPSEDGSVVDLEELWAIDLNPREYRYTPEGKKIPYTEDERLWWRYPVGFPDSDEWAPVRSRRESQLGGPCEAIAMPAVVGNRFYLGLGRDSYYTRPEAPGRFMCFELTEPRRPPKLVWESREVRRTQSTASVHEGLVYISDQGGFLHCLDADTGEHAWKTQLGKKIVHRSQMVADGRIYVGCGRDMYVLKTGRNCEIVSESRLAGEPATLEADDGIAVLSMGRYLAAYRPAELIAETGSQPNRGEKR